MTILTVHYETFDDESFEKLKELAERGPIAITIAPFHTPRIPDAQKETIKEYLKKGGYVLGQQGLNHHCEKCSKERPRVDAWHENDCLWGEGIGIEEQERFMTEGRKKLEETFGIRPELYTPPNHLMNNDTIRIARKLGYKWVSDRAMMKVEPYFKEGIMIIPESEPEIAGNNQVYIHADRWNGNLEEAIMGGIKPYSSLIAKPKDGRIIRENHRLKIIRKIARDLHGAYGNEGLGFKEKALELVGFLYDNLHELMPHRW
ncbi:hypothetical protein COU61_01995 [Candidatus Pacearchaeota archaeon CG10_big_fil_rev_8_21_14_0_10_35_13]|nr:MAG: hypothetical protein COU61_01995 [Candidatus Pacearchaeota archaeon CG10_big_fil_rev_8_21_14_0_10_35_13]